MPQTFRAPTQIINLADSGYQNLAENHMDIMFGFFETDSSRAVKYPLTLPESYGKFRLFVGGTEKSLEDCDAARHFHGVDS